MVTPLKKVGAKGEDLSRNRNYSLPRSQRGGPVGWESSTSGRKWKEIATGSMKSDAGGVGVAVRREEERNLGNRVNRKPVKMRLNSSDTENNTEVLPSKIRINSEKSTEKSIELRDHLSTDLSTARREERAEVNGFESFGRREFVKYPILGINQPTSDYKPEGVFHNRLTGESYPEIEVVFLAIKRNMQYRPGGFGDPIPVCFSSDALKPDPAVKEPIHPICHRLTDGGLVPECPKAQWVRDRLGKPRRECSLIYKAAIQFLDQQFLFYIHGRSIAPLSRFLSQLRQMRLPLFGVQVKLRLKYRTKKEGFAGNFYELDFPDLLSRSDLDRIKFTDAEKFRPMAAFFKDIL